MELIAGPIVRHSNRQEINIWFVLDEPANTVSCSVFEGGVEKGINTQESIAPFQAGKKVFGYLVKIKPKPDSKLFSVDSPLQYDIAINGVNLAGMGLTTGEKRICYLEGGLPELILKDSHSVILHGSCRKPHASHGKHSQPDMMLAADDLVAEHQGDADKRPSLLFLTGDQIYADDVAAPMLANIRRVAKTYVGDGDANFGDAIPYIKKNGSVGYKALGDFEFNGRAEFLSESEYGITSGEKDNHLLSFAEYLMMYLLAWGGLGEQQCPPYSEIKDRLKKTVEEDDDLWYLDSSYPDYRREMLVCNSFLDQSWKVRRLLANIVTYMMFDDHEVTDDWNLIKANRKALRENLFSRHIQSNALAAFWLCQGWGNTPDEFTPKFFDDLRQYLESYDENKFDSYESTLLNRYWGFELNTDPYTVILDTRTKRTYGKNGLPRLMDKSTLTRHWKRINKFVQQNVGHKTFLLVSPAPVYGFTRVERMQLKAVEVLSKLSTTLDAECWIANENGFKQLQSIIMSSGFENCVIFSGDVHYGYCRREEQVAADGSTVNIYQFTSSSLHNAPGVTGAIGIGMLAVGESFGRAYSSYLLPDGFEHHFLNQSTNMGVLYLDKGSPLKMELISSGPVAEDQKPESDGRYTWAYTIGKSKTLSM